MQTSPRFIEFSFIVASSHSAKKEGDTTMVIMEKTSYISQLVMPQAKATRTARRIWSIDLETVWLPVFHATNIMGETSMSAEALGAPLRLATGKDGSVKFSQSGKPVIRVVKEVSDMVKLIRENFTAGLQSYAHEVITENTEAYELSVKQAIEAGKPIIAHDTAMLSEAIRRQVEAEVEAIRKAKAEAVKPEAEAVKPKVRKAKAEAEAVKPEAEKIPELASV